MKYLLSDRRTPTVVYCDYDVSHTFPSMKEYREHLKECPCKAEVEAKQSKGHDFYSKNQKWIENSKQKKKKRGKKQPQPP